MLSEPTRPECCNFANALYENMTVGMFVCLLFCIDVSNMIGARPKKVVSVVSIIGLKRRTPALEMASK